MTAQPRILSAGELALLVELDSLEQVMGLEALLRRRTIPGVVDIIPAARTVFISAESPVVLAHVRELLASATADLHRPSPGTIHRIKTRYDGADLADAARLAGVSVEALVNWHSGQPWISAFGGFAPGFMYLTPTDRALLVPRRDTPRTAVPAGAVAVGGEFSAIYPGPTPGGWQLLGHCADVLWDIEREPAALIRPGDGVEFMPVRELIERAASDSPAASADSEVSADPGAGFTVVSPGIHTTVQDLGRAGFAHLGVPASGALDRASLRRANRLVGNESRAAGLEIVLSGLSLRASGSHVVALTGTAAELHILDASGAEHAFPADAPTILLHGDVLTIRPGTEGFRSYLAVRGGLNLPEVLGSRSTDMLSSLGPEPLTAGRFLGVGTGGTGVVGSPEAPRAVDGGMTELCFVPGPRDDWFTAESLANFEEHVWEVGAASNRIGLRLAGTPLQRTPETWAAELPSEGLAKGAIQVPPSGLPVLFLADHPVTGGYPVLGVVRAADLDRAAHLAPGSRLRFRRA